MYDLRFVLMTRSKEWMWSVSRMFAAPCIPWLRTRMSRWSHWLIVSVMSLLHSCGLERSTAMALCCATVCGAYAAAAPTLSGLRPLKTTVAPWAANSSAIALPMPDDEPVTRTTFPSNCSGSVFLELVVCVMLHFGAVGFCFIVWSLLGCVV